MDRRVITVVSLVLIALLLWKRGLIQQAIAWGGLKLKPADDQVFQLPVINGPDAPSRFEKGPAFWQQTTGLMCACNDKPYTAPIVMREINIPEIPFPHFVYGG